MVEPVHCSNDDLVKSKYLKEEKMQFDKRNEKQEVEPLDSMSSVSDAKTVPKMKDSEAVTVSASSFNRRETMVHKNPDGRLAWLMCFCIFAIFAITFGLLRTYGVLYVNILETYKTNRELASWPFSLCSTVFHLMGKKLQIAKLTHL